MTFIAYIIAKLFGIDADRAFRYAVYAVIGIGLAVLIAIGLYIESCNSNRETKKIEAAKEEILEGKVEANLQGLEVNKRVNATNEAFNNLKNAQNQNLSNYSTNANDALKRFDCQVEKNCK